LRKRSLAYLSFRKKKWLGIKKRRRTGVYGEGKPEVGGKKVGMPQSERDSERGQMVESGKTRASGFSDITAGKSPPRNVRER